MPFHHLLHLLLLLLLGGGRDLCSSLVLKASVLEVLIATVTNGELLQNSVNSQPLVGSNLNTTTHLCSYTQLKSNSFYCLHPSNINLLFCLVSIHCRVYLISSVFNAHLTLPRDCLFCSPVCHATV